MSKPVASIMTQYKTVLDSHVQWSEMISSLLDWQHSKVVGHYPEGSSIRSYKMVQTVLCKQCLAYVQHGPSETVDVQFCGWLVGWGG